MAKETITMSNETHQTHPFPPIYDKNSQILILGSFPSVKSREEQFYYAHPQNRFWKLLSTLYSEDTPCSISEKKALLMRHHIAIWDVIKSCDIIGSSDSSIKNVSVNDISFLLQHSNIHTVYANGAKSYDLYMKYAFPMTKKEIKKLPSTSPANAVYTINRLEESWKQILQV